MPIENDPLRPPPEEPQNDPPAWSSLTDIERRLRTGSNPEHGEAIREHDFFDHSCSVQMLYILVFLASCCCLGGYFMLKMGFQQERLPYSEELAEARLVRLYQTGYDPLMERYVRKWWVETVGEPNLVEVAGRGHHIGHGFVMFVFVKRGPEYQTDLIGFSGDGLINRYEADYDYRITPFFTDAAVRIDASIYPATADQIPEAFAPQ